MCSLKIDHITHDARAILEHESLRASVQTTVKYLFRASIYLKTNTPFGEQERHRYRGY
jgi:hypothetical protein